jgi:serine/threonine-protein kinase
MLTRQEFLAIGEAVRMGVLSPDQLARICDDSWRRHRPLIEIIVDSGWVSAEQWSRITAKVVDDELVDDVVREAEAVVDRTLTALDGIGREIASDQTNSGDSAGGRYTRLGLVGRGGTAEVWRAHDDQLGREVALKQPRTDLPNAPVDRLMAEAEVLCRLRHPNIVPLYDLVTDPGRTRPQFYIMPLLLGPTLGEAAATFHSARPVGGLRRTLMPLLTAFQGVCRAVAHAHDRGVLHLDLKGANIKLGDHGEAVVLDWGLARVEGAVPIQPAGTPGYLAPEQTEGGHSLDRRTDVYGLGAVLYELLTGKAPFKGTTTTETLNRVRMTSPVPPSTLWSGVPRPLEAICLRALARLPEDRYPTAEALREEIEHWLTDEPVSAYPERIVGRATRWARHHGRAVGGVVASILLAVAALTFGLIRADHARADADEQKQVAIHALAAERESLGLALRAGNDCFAFADDRLANLDGSEPIRLRLLERYLSHHESLLIRYQNDPDVRLEVASTRVRIGWSYAWLARQREALAAFEAAMPTLKELGSQAEVSDRVQGLLIDALLGATRVHWAVGDRQIAWELLTKAEAQATTYAQQAPMSGDRYYRLGVVSEVRATLEFDHQSSVNAYRAAAELLGQAANAGRDPDRCRDSRVACFLAAANRLRHLNKPAEALESVREAMREYGHMGADGSQIQSVQRWIGTCVSMEGAIYMDQKKYPQAIESLRRAASLRRNLVERNPSIRNYRVELAASLANLGRVLRLIGRFEDARNPAYEACEKVEQALGEEPESVHVRNLAGLFRLRMGMVALSMEEWGDAAREFRQARDHLAPLLAKPQPTQAHLENAVDAELGLGLALARQNRWREAFATWREGGKLYLEVTPRVANVPTPPGKK